MSVVRNHVGKYLIFSGSKYCVQQYKVSSATFWIGVHDYYMSILYTEHVKTKPKQQIVTRFA